MDDRLVAKPHPPPLLNGYPLAQFGRIDARIERNLGRIIEPQRGSRHPLQIAIILRQPLQLVDRRAQGDFVGPPCSFRDGSQEKPEINHGFRGTNQLADLTSQETSQPDELVGLGLPLTVFDRNERWTAAAKEPGNVLLRLAARFARFGNA